MDNICFKYSCDKGINRFNCVNILILLTFNREKLIFLKTTGEKIDGFKVKLIFTNIDILYEKKQEKKIKLNFEKNLYQSFCR